MDDRHKKFRGELRTLRQPALDNATPRSQAAQKHKRTRKPCQTRPEMGEEINHLV
jgi:hypothetical protein